MKKKILKTKKSVSHAKTLRPASAKRCDCCGESPCACPESHDHKK